MPQPSVESPTHSRRRSFPLRAPPTPPAALRQGLRRRPRRRNERNADRTTCVTWFWQCIHPVSNCVSCWHFVGAVSSCHCQCCQLLTLSADTVSAVSNWDFVLSATDTVSAVSYWHCHCYRLLTLSVSITVTQCWHCVGALSNWDFVLLATDTVSAVVVDVKCPQTQSSEFGLFCAIKMESQGHRLWAIRTQVMIFLKFSVGSRNTALRK